LRATSRERLGATRSAHATLRGQKGRLLMRPKRATVGSGSRTRLPLQQTDGLAGRFAPRQQLQRARAEADVPAVSALGTDFPALGAAKA
jgi:hypothetical protein